MNKPRSLSSISATFVQSCLSVFLRLYRYYKRYISFAYCTAFLWLKYGLVLKYKSFKTKREVCSTAHVLATVALTCPKCCLTGALCGPDLFMSALDSRDITRNKQLLHRLQIVRQLSRIADAISLVVKAQTTEGQIRRYCHSILITDTTASYFVTLGQLSRRDLALLSLQTNINPRG